MAKQGLARVGIGRHGAAKLCKAVEAGTAGNGWDWAGLDLIGPGTSGMVRRGLARTDAAGDVWHGRVWRELERNGAALPAQLNR